MGQNFIKEYHRWKNPLYNILIDEENEKLYLRVNLDMRVQPFQLYLFGGLLLIMGIMILVMQMVAVHEYSWISKFICIIIIGFEIAFSFLTYKYIKEVYILNIKIPGIIMMVAISTIRCVSTIPVRMTQLSKNNQSNLPLMIPR